MKESLLDLLLDLGLPHVSKGGHLYFDGYDLFNVNVDLRLPGVRWRFMRGWSRFLNLAHQDVNSVYKFTVRTACPRPGHAGPCDFRFNSFGASSGPTSR